MMNTTAINLNEYFDFLDQDDIRIKGTRVGLETVIDDYLNACSPEEIALRYPTLTLEQVYATITFYLHNQREVDSYLERWRKHAEESWRHQQELPHVQKLLELKMRKQENLRKVNA